MELLAKPVAAEEETTQGGRDSPISELKAGESGVVRSYAGGRGMLGRCLSMGFTPGSQVRMIENYGRGPILVSVCDTGGGPGTGDSREDHGGQEERLMASSFR